MSVVDQLRLPEFLFRADAVSAVEAMEHDEDDDNKKNSKYDKYAIVSADGLRVGNDYVNISKFFTGTTWP